MNIIKCKNLDFFLNKNVLKIKLLKKQGLCNKIYKVTCPNKNYLIREFKKEEHSYLSKKEEFKLQKKLFKKELAAKVYYLDDKLMICDYLKGVHKKNLKKKDIKNLSKKLKKLHKIKIKQKKYKFKKDLYTYKNSLKDKESKKIIKKSFLLLKELQNLKKENVLCHHDLNQQNILFYKKKVFFIDWEFSSINDKFFDLANIFIEFNFTQKEEKIFLYYYLKKIKNKDLEKLEIYKTLYRNLWKLWFKRYNS